MTKATEALFELGKDAILFCQNGPNAHCVMYDGAWIAFSGVQQLADLNMVGITASASKNRFDGLLKEAEKRKVDAILFIAADAANALEWAVEKGLSAAGQAPLMEKIMTTSPAITSNKAKAQLCDSSEVTQANTMGEKAFSLPENSFQKALPSKTYDDPAIDLWMAKTEDNQPLGCGSFVRDFDGERVGIYAMATPPNNQRRGAGRAVIENAMQYYQAKGVKRFTLGATEVGFPLYQKLGFEVVAEPYVFILGASTQFSAQ
jgi:GNAT superfamily N-acetyltransferase